MFRNIVLKGFVLVFAAVFAVVFFVQPTYAQTASHIYLGDANVACSYTNGAVHAVYPDSDGLTGQVVEVRNCPTVKVTSDYGFSWVGHSAGNVKAAINDLLISGCGLTDGCPSVRYFVITQEGVQSYVVNMMYPMTPKIDLTVSAGATYNQKVYHINVQDVGLWMHCLQFGDGGEYCFDGSDTKISVPHDFDWKGGTFKATLVAKIPNGSTLSDQVTVTIPHP